MLRPASLALAVISFYCTPQHVWASSAGNPDWSAQARIPQGQDRANIYQLGPLEQIKAVRAGKVHSLVYPVSNTKLLLPYRPMQEFLAADEHHPLKIIATKLAGKKIDIRSEEAFFKWIGLTPYPASEELNVYSPFHVPASSNGLPMGAAQIQTPQGKGMTFSCTACHAQQLFGRAVIGLPNKRPRSNELFLLGKKYTPFIPTPLFAVSTGATREETAIFEQTKKYVQATGGKTPQSLGLDTSLAQVTLSLAHRAPDPWAQYSAQFQRRPRANMFDHHIADSRPLPWWNVKYKTRWLSDGSVVSGNPILTNILWNEIGRGADLKELATWMEQNQVAIRELTAAVFASQAPHWTDYFEAVSINESLARQGEALFNRSCVNCHGGYEKGWSLPLAPLMTKKQRLQTVRVHYTEQTQVKDVGTDPGRYEGAKAVALALNPLAISQKMQTVIEPQKGYVPPPLVGIWARYPYFHNNSVPSLCGVLTVASARPKTFYQGPADNVETDFDQECVGYPTGDAIPAAWKRQEDLVDTKRPGISNQGHEKMLLNSDGTEKFSAADKLALIEFLKTL